MDSKNKDEGISAGWYFLGGLAVGAAAGVLLAPKPGSETRDDVAEWTRLGREKTRSLISRIGAAVPSRVKAAAVAGAVKGGAGEVLDEARGKAKEFAGS